MTYQLPEPIFHNGIHSYYSPYQMQQAYAAGRESMRQECLQICAHTPCYPFRPALEVAHAIKEIV